MIMDLIMEMGAVVGVTYLVLFAALAMLIVGGLAVDRLCDDRADRILRQIARENARRLHPSNTGRRLYLVPLPSPAVAVRALTEAELDTRDAQWEAERAELANLDLWELGT